MPDAALITVLIFHRRKCPDCIADKTNLTVAAVVRGSSAGLGRQSLQANEKRFSRIARARAGSYVREGFQSRGGGR